MNNPEQLQLLTTEQSREESQRSRDALENSKDSDKIKKVTVSQKRYCLTIITLVTIIVVLMIALLTTLLLSRNSGEKSKKLVTCWSKECMGIAAMQKNYQNTSVDPCDDFFEHTCGRFYEHSREDSSFAYLEFKSIMFQVYSSVRKTKHYSSRPNEQLRIFAKKCNDRKAMNSDSLEELRQDIEARGGFPMIDPDWEESKFDLSDMLSKHMSITRKRMPFLAVEPFNSIVNGTLVNLLYVSPGPHFVDSMAHPIRYYKESVAFMLERLLKLENRTLDRVEYEKDYQAVIDLEASLVKLANYSTVRVDTDDMSKARTLNDLVKAIPEIDWVKIIRALPREKMTDEEEKEFISKIRVHGGGNYFFGEKRELAQIATTTPKTVLANYMAVRHVSDVALYYYDKDLPRQNKFYHHDNQQLFCASQLGKFFPMPSMNVYMKASEYKMKNVEIAEEVFELVKEVYVETFTEAEWLEPEIREFMIRKVKAITGRMWFKQYIDGQPLLENMYKTLDLQETDSPYQIYLKLWRHRTEQLVEHIKHNTPLNPVNLKQFHPYATYQSYGNYFYITMPYLVYPFVDADFPTYINYAFLGWVIGHEVGHAFDNFHRKLDENGKKHDMWSTKTNASNMEYEKREKCLGDQYSNYKEPGYDFFMDGTKSRLEIAADNLGFNTAYRIFQKTKDLNTVKLPGLDDVTPEQMFFYSYALRQCDVYDPTVPERVLKERVHPTLRFRVNGVYRNSPEFSKAFNCAKEAAMNLPNKCTLF